MKQLSAQKRGIGLRVAIQGELGSNSHMATVEMLGNQGGVEIIACTVSAQVLAKVVAGEVDGAVLPIEIGRASCRERVCHNV